MQRGVQNRGEAFGVELAEGQLPLAQPVQSAEQACSERFRRVSAAAVLAVRVCGAPGRPVHSDAGLAQGHGTARSADYDHEVRPGVQPGFGDCLRCLPRVEPGDIVDACLDHIS
jgi:hypothetical protein